MQKCWLSLNISSEICFGSIKKYIHKYIFLVFELQISLDRLESATKQMYTLKLSDPRSYVNLKKNNTSEKTPQRCSARTDIFEKEETGSTWKHFNNGISLPVHADVLMPINSLQ